MVRKWKNLVNDYVRGRQGLKRVLVLIDARHGLKPVDIEVMTMLDKAAVSFQIVLTKADKIKPTQAEATLAQVAELARKHPAAYPHLLSTSSEKGFGIAELRAAVIAAL